MVNLSQLIVLVACFNYYFLTAEITTVSIGSSVYSFSFPQSGKHAKTVVITGDAEPAAYTLTS